LSEYTHKNTFLVLKSKDIIDMVLECAKALELDESAIDSHLLGFHSLHAGVMAIKLYGYDNTTIMKMGR
jgi:hypothetical protein